MNEPDFVAAIDLGSNSFHMIVAQMDDQRLKVVDRMKEMVRLAAGLDHKNRLSDEVMERAMACLNRFGQRLRDIPPTRLRIVGTNTLRTARNSAEFLKQAERVLGHPIDIIAGREEARLIYLGVSHSLEDDASTRLVVDIGGGSTELILGRHFEPQQMESLYMGCVSISHAYFPDQTITAERFKRAELACLQELEPVQKSYTDTGWDTSIGASGTCLTVHDVIVAQGWSKTGISAGALYELKRALIKAGDIRKFKSTALSTERAPVFAGGVAVLSAVFEALNIDHMTVSSGALREGVIYDLVGRIQHEDVRDHGVRELMNHYRIDVAQAERVQGTADAMLAQVREKWGLTDDEAANLLRWASWLHEIGLAIAHDQYQKHGAYMISHMDVRGFSRGEQMRLAVIVRGHRRKFPVREFENFSGAERALVERLCVLLRIAVLVHRARAGALIPRIKAKAEGGKLKLRFPAGWLENHPLTEADLSQEAGWLKAGGYNFSFR